MGTLSGARGSTLDRLLELSVVGSWSKLGYVARSRDWDDHFGALEGRRILVTGGTNGIGRAAAQHFAYHGARVGIVGRDATRARRAAEELGELTGSHVWSAEADLADLAQVRELAGAVEDWAGGRLDGLVHCAGTLRHEWEAGPSGIETTVATHVVGPHLLTSRLEGLRSPGSIVVWVSSGGMYTQPLDVESLETPPDSFRGSVAYARAKRAQVALAELWDRRLRPRGRSFVMHPGWVDTDALQEGLPRFARLAAPLLRTPAQGADTAVWLTAGGAPPDAPPSFWLDRRARPTRRWPGPGMTQSQEAALWEWCQRRAGLGAEAGTP
jgi:dehydrogenase/reductase SDR family member 12